MFYDPTESATCCTWAQTLMNFVVLVYGCYEVAVIAAWGYWFKNNSEVHAVNEWQNAILTSIVVVQLAQYLTFVILLVFLRFQRSTLAIVPSKVRWRPALKDEDDRFEAGVDIDKNGSDTSSSTRSHRKRPKRVPKRIPMPEPPNKQEEQEDTRLTAQVEALVNAMGPPETSAQIDEALHTEVSVELESKQSDSNVKPQ